MQWPPKLRDLFEVDDDDVQYPMPFEDPRLLMENFSNLEEKNLQLIRQCQEADEQIEKKKEQLSLDKAKNTKEIEELTKKVDDIKKKIEKTQNEKDNMEEKKSNVEDKMMPRKICDEIAERVRSIVLKLLPN